MRTVRFFVVGVLWVVLYSWLGPLAMRGQSVSCTGTGGYDATGGVQFTSFNQQNNQWNFVVTCSASGPGNPGGGATYDTTSCTWSRGGGQSPAAGGVGQCVSGYVGTLSVTSGNGGSSGAGSATLSITAPAAPSIQKAVTFSGTYSGSVPVVMALYDPVSGQYFNPEQVNPGQSYIMQGLSTGDPLQLVAITQSLAQFNAGSTSGDGSFNASTGVLSAGTSAVQLLIDQAQYSQMQITSNSGGSDPTGQSQINPTTNPTVGGVLVSAGGGGPQDSSATGNGAVGITGLPFSSGTGTSQTGNTSGATNGVLTQVGNAIVAADAGIVSAIQQGNGTITNTNSTIGNWPSNYPDSAAIAKLTDIDSILSGGSSWDGGSSELTNANSAAGSALSTLSSEVSGYVPSSGAGSSSVPSTVPGDIATANLSNGDGLTTTPVTISFIPGSQWWASAHTLLETCRPLIAWAMVIGFAALCGEMMHGYIIGLMNTPQIQSSTGIEDTVPGVAQGKNLLLATAVTGACAFGVAALLGLVQGDLGTLGVSGLTTTGGLSSGHDFTSLGGGVALLNQYLPCLLFVELAVLKATLHFQLSQAYAIAATTVRFLNI